jgi:hypothetical protein
MRLPRFWRLALVGSLVAALLTANDTAPAGAAPTPPSYRPGSLYPAGCNAASKATGTTAFARCYAEGLATSDGRLAQQPDDPLPTSLGPADIQSAYHLPGGGASYPPEDPDWSVETALDLDAVSSACPDCHILLVQADDNSSPNLGAGVNTAASLGAVAISNSYGVPGEIPFESHYDHYYDHAGIAITVSSGDYGNVQSYPATNPNVVAVGGTTLTRDSSARGWHESAWWSGGSGCSQYEPRPDYQQGVSTGCPDARATADIAADADPDSGLAVYNTLGQDGGAQWGGTSLASPLVAAMYALAGTPVPGTYPVTYPYRAGQQLNDVSDGSNGFCGNLLCNAGPGWDGPTGLGTPDGVSALTLGAFGHVTGTVTDGTRHQPVADATVTMTGSTGYTFHAVTDNAGHYSLAAAAGSYHVVATKFGYGEQSLDDAAVAADGTLAANFSLPVLPTRGISGAVTDGSGQGWPVYAKITIAGYPRGAVYTNPFTGRYQDRGFTPAGGKHRPTASGAALRRVKIAASWQPFATRTTPPNGVAQPQVAAAGAAWSDLPWYPTPIMDNLVAEEDGVVYSVAGFADSGITAAAYAYHSDSRSWTRIADLPQPLESPVGGFADGKLYAAGGWDANGNPVSTAYAYDPRTNAWSRVADLPAPLAAAAATSANGELYVVAGCTTPACVPASTATYRYDPNNDAWTRLADYPQPVVLPGCASTGGGIVCAGGLTPLDTYPGQEPSSATYQYVAGNNAWTRVADMPYPDWGMAYAGSDGKLQVVGGVANGSVTNQASQFDPSTGAWSALPNANDAVYRGGAACGLYRIGGSLPAISGLEPTPYAEHLPTGDACISGSDVAWLAESSSDVEIPAGRSVTVTVAFDASGVSVAGEYGARLAVATDTPYPVSPVPVAMTVKG